jgi:hypothetical protein
MMDVEKVADGVFKAMEAHLNKALAPILAKLEALEAKQIPMAADIVAEVLKSEVLANHAASEVKKALEANPPKDGKDAEPIAVSEVVAELLATDGLKSLVDLQAAESVAAYFAENPVIHGKDATPVSEEQLAQQVSKYMTANPVVSQKGQDGAGVAGAMIDREGNLLLTLSNGVIKELGQVVGKDGRRGEDGKDGLGFDDLTVSFDGEALVHEYKRGEKSLTQRFPLNVMKHIGFWRQGMKAQAGNTTTAHGSLWICIKDTSEFPAYDSADWQLAARKGRDGQDKTDAKPPEPVKLHGN